MTTTNALWDEGALITGVPNGRVMTGMPLEVQQAVGVLYAGGGGGGVSSLNGLTGALVLTSPGATLSIGTAGSDITLDLDTSTANTWTGLQSFGNHISIAGIPFNITGTPISGQVVTYNGSAFVLATAGTAGVSSLNTLTGALTIASPSSTLTIGTVSSDVDVDVDLTHANTWTGVQTFGNAISIGGAQFAISTLSAGQVAMFDGTNCVNVAGGALASTAASGYVLTTGSTTILSTTPGRQTLVAVEISLSVSSPTTVTLTLTYTDPVAGAVSLPIASGLSVPAGQVTVTRVLADATTTTAIALSGSAGAGSTVTAFVSFVAAGE